MSEPSSVAPGQGWIDARWPAAAQVPAQLTAGCTTRAGGVSSGRYSDNNLALHVGDDGAGVVANRRVLQARLGARLIQWLDQVHGNDCLYIDDSATSLETPAADAMWTDQSGIALAIMTADCVPVLLADRQGRCVGAAHAGWQGLEQGVIAELIGQMPVEADELIAWIGPCISASRYEVGEDVWARFIEDYSSAMRPHRQDRAKRLLDITEIARLQMVEQGVAYISACGLCSYDDDRFYSHRRATSVGEEVTGRMASVILLG